MEPLQKCSHAILSLLYLYCVNYTIAMALNVEAKLIMSLHVVANFSRLTMIQDFIIVTYTLSGFQQNVWEGGGREHDK